VQEAHQLAGVSVSAIRKWYRADVIASRETAGPHGPQRLVRLDDVIARRDAWEGRPYADGSTRTPEGMLLVPMAEWQRTLEALAGGMASFHGMATQLADSGHTLGRAEERAEFYKVQLAEAKAAAKASELKVRQLEQELLEVRAAEAVSRATRRGLWRRS
jgi:hypothetical protein